MEYFDGIDFPEGHDTYCRCDKCNEVQDAIVAHHRRLRAANRITKNEAIEIENRIILDHIEMNYRP